MPLNIAEYLQKHKMDATVNRIVNAVLKERPADPLSAIAMHLLR